MELKIPKYFSAIMPLDVFSKRLPVHNFLLIPLLPSALLEASLHHLSRLVLLHHMQIVLDCSPRTLRLAPVRRPRGRRSLDLLLTISTRIPSLCAGVKMELC